MKYVSILFLFFSVNVFAKDIDLSEMSQRDKNATGLYKLSEDEMAALQDWLNHKKRKVAIEEKRKNAGFEGKQQAERETIHATLERVYQDQLGNTYYHLTNGQVWKKVQSGQITVDNSGQQQVTISPKSFGSWLMKGKGNRGVKVKRVR